MKNFTKSKNNINNDEASETQEEENIPINTINNSNSSIKKKKIKKIKSDNFFYFLIIALLLIIALIILIILIYLKNFESTVIKEKRQTNVDINNDNNNKNNLAEIEQSVNLININDNKEDDYKKMLKEISKSSENINSKNGKIGVAFVWKSLFGNGIGRALSLLCSGLANLEIYDIYMITGSAVPSLDFDFDERVHMVRVGSNKTKIQKFDETSNIKIYVLQNELNPSGIKWYRNLNGGKKVIGIMHGVYMSSIFSNLTGVYSIWKNNQLFDAYIQVNADDYYINKRLGINNSFFLPNLYTYDPETTPSSNLTYKNVVLIGRQLDKIKGGIYAIKAMDIVRREIPDAKLYFISSNYKITFLQNLIEELNLKDNIEVLHFTKNITKYFLNSSVFVNPSLSEACPMVINEAKAHGMPIVGFNLSYSFPYQTGVITAQVTNYTQMAEEIIKLLKDYNYRKQKGFEAKESMKRISDNEILYKWIKLFEVLLNDDMEGFKKLQEMTFDKKYYDEETAREHLESNWKQGQIFNKYFCCHDFNDMLNITYINNIKSCKNQSLCK